MLQYRWHREPLQLPCLPASGPEAAFEGLADWAKIAEAKPDFRFALGTIFPSSRLSLPGYLEARSARDLPASPPQTSKNWREQPDEWPRPARKPADLLPQIQK